MNGWQIKRAEHAMAAGRLDEAYELARQEAIREHRLGQRLVSRLVERLLERGAAHLEADRADAAAADAAKAERLAGNTPAVAELRAAAMRALASRTDAQHRRQRTLSAADRAINGGFLSQARRLIESANEDRGIAVMQDELANRQTGRDEAERRAREAMKRGDFSSAIEHMIEARQYGAPGDEGAAIIAELIGGVDDAARKALTDGRLDVAADWLHRVQRIKAGEPHVKELARVIGYCREAARALASGDANGASSALHRVRGCIGAAKWLDESIEHANEAARHEQLLRHGPLGLLREEDDSMVTTQNRPHIPQRLSGTSSHTPKHRPVDRPLPRIFMMQVDGVGGFLTASGRSVTVGPVSSSAKADIGLVADPNLPVVRIERQDEDYFAAVDSAGERAIEVDGRATRRTLLNDGARIALSPRCRLRFRRPASASSSAVLDLSGARLLHGDVRRVLLMDGELVIGPDGACHITAPALDSRIVLRATANGLTCASSHAVTVDDQAWGDAALPIGRRIRIGSMSLVLTDRGGQ